MKSKLLPKPKSHRDVVSQRKPVGAAPTHTVINIDLASLVSSPASTRDAPKVKVPTATGLKKGVGDGLDGIRALSASVAQLVERAAPLIEARKAMKDADARDEARRERATPAAVNAANAARWGRKA